MGKVYLTPLENSDQKMHQMHLYRAPLDFKQNYCEADAGAASTPLSTRVSDRVAWPLGTWLSRNNQHMVPHDKKFSKTKGKSFEIVFIVTPSLLLFLHI